VPANEPSYLREMLTSQTNVYALLGSVAAGLVLSIPFGFGLGAVPLVVFGAGEAIAAMFVPSSPTFRAKVDRRFREQAREGMRAHLEEEIRKRVGNRNASRGSMAAYGRMVDRVASMYRIAEDRRTQLSVRDVERLDDATLDYLSVWLAILVIDDRSAAVDLREIERRLETIDRDLGEAKAGMDLRQLQKARAEYAGLVGRHRRMLSRKTALEAALVSMPDQMEEIYQTIVTAPTSSDVGSRLEDAIARLRLEEDVEAELAGELGESVPDFSARLQQRQAETRKLQPVRRETA
jgi:hypothetical protein